MGKNIILTEDQFKLYVKGMLLNEDLGFLDDLEDDEMSPEEIQKKKNEIAKNIRTWIKGKRTPFGAEYTKIAPVDLHLDKIRVAPGQFESTFNEPGLENTPMTYDEFCDKAKRSDERFLISSAQDYALGTCNKTYLNDLKSGKGVRNHRDPTTQNIEDFQRMNLKGKDKKVFDDKQAAIKRDADFKNTLWKAISNPEHPSYGKIPRNGVDPKAIENEMWFRKIKEFCNENHILYTESGDIYVPIKADYEKVRQKQLRQQDEKVRNLDDFKFFRAFATKFPEPTLTLLYDIDPGTIQAKELNKYAKQGILTGPVYKFIGFGGKENIMGGYFYFSYRCDAERALDNRKPMTFDNARSM